MNPYYPNIGLKQDQLYAFFTQTQPHIQRQATALPLEKAWEMLSPIVPDCLEEVTPGIYEAKWWKPIPMNDVQMLLEADYVRIHAEPYEPENLPAGLGVRFSFK